MRRLLYIFLSLIVISSCRRELCYDYRPFTDVSLEVDWSEFSETPSGMTAMFYPVDGGEPTVYSTHDIHRTDIPLRTGVYNVLLFNQRPTEFIYLGFRGMDRYETAEVYALELDSKTWYSKSEVETVASEPEPFAVASYENFEVTEEMKAARELQRTMKSGLVGTPDLLLTPKAITSRCLVTINVQGVYNLRSARGSITGMSEGMSLNNLVATASEVTHLLERWQCLDDDSNPVNGLLKTEYMTFGVPGMKLSKADEIWDDARLKLSVLLVDNSTILDYEFSVKDHITLSDETGEMVLRIDIEKSPVDPDDAPVILPDVKPAGGDSSGFDAEMDSWGDEVTVNVQM